MADRCRHWGPGCAVCAERAQHQASGRLHDFELFHRRSLGVTCELFVYEPPLAERSMGRSITRRFPSKQPLLDLEWARDAHIPAASATLVCRSPTAPNDARADDSHHGFELAMANCHCAGTTVEGENRIGFRARSIRLARRSDSRPCFIVGATRAQRRTE